MTLMLGAGWLAEAGEWVAEECNAELYAKRWRLHYLANMVEGLRIPRTKKPQKEKLDRNLLSRLPKRDADLDDALWECFQMARRGKTETVDEWNFEVFWRANLAQLAADIRGRRWKPSSSKAFVTHTPVDREIFAAPFRDRIVHHFLYAVVSPWWEKRFIYDSYSCRRGRGTDFGIRRMRKFMLAASRCGTQEAYVVKGD